MCAVCLLLFSELSRPPKPLFCQLGLMVIPPHKEQDLVCLRPSWLSTQALLAPQLGDRIRPRALPKKRTCLSRPRLSPSSDNMEETGHPQSATRIRAADNSSAQGFVNCAVKQRRSRTFDRRFWWLKDEEALFCNSVLQFGMLESAI